MGNFSGLQAIVSRQAPAELGDRPEEALNKVNAPVQTADISIIHQSRFQKFPPLPDDVAKLRESVRSVGILEALLVRPHPDKPGELELLAGHTRKEAAIGLLTELPVKVFEVSDEVAIEIVTATNLQRKVLDPIAETDAILELLAVKTGKTRSEVLSLFYQRGNGKNNVILTPEWQAIEDVFASTTRTNPESFRTNKLPLLNLPTEILDAVRKGQLEYTKAMLISRVKDPDAQLAILERAIQLGLTLAQIKEAIAQSKGEKEMKGTTATRASDVARLIKKAKLDPKKAAKVDAYLAKIQEILGEQDL